MIISKSITFAAAHRLLEHAGKCRFLHGHTYEAEIVLEGDVGASGFVVDFGDIRAKVGAWIAEHWDHATLAARADVALVAFCEAHSAGRVYVFEGPPTAENIAVELLAIARSVLAPAKVVSVRVRETESCCAEAS